METNLSRRSVIAAGGIGLIGLPALARPILQAGHERDWAWLIGNWDVHHRRLRDRLVGSTTWDEFAGKSALWLTMGGLGTIDDNSLALPGGDYRAISIRAFDPATRQWAIWWLDGRNSGRIEPPVLGGFTGDEGSFTGADVHKGQPVTARFRWHDIHGARPNWDQALSTDGGKSWEINWRNWFTRTSPTPAPLPMLADAPHDFDFLVGSWNVRHRKLKTRLAGSNDWDEFDRHAGQLAGDGRARQYRRQPDGRARRQLPRHGHPHLGSPMRESGAAGGSTGATPPPSAPRCEGGFADGIGIFEGADSLNGRPIRTRVRWLRITPGSARWEQSASADDGATWEVNWISDFQRRA